MQLAITIILFVVGLAFIIKGGDLFVDAAAWMAEASGIPKFLIGATVVSFATTLPELLVSLLAVAQGKVDLSVGNAVGSVTANTALIMAVAMVCLPTVIRRKDYLLKALLLLGASSVLLVCGFQGGVGLTASLLLFGIFAVSLADNIIGARQAMALSGGAAAGGRPRPAGKTVAVNLLKFLFGAVGIVAGAQLLVNSGSDLARLAGVSERIIGVTIIAVGTSLPELVTTVTAISKKQASLSFGNIIGANIIDLTLILPLCALVSGQRLPITQGFASFDLPACLAVGALALVPSLFTRKFSRWQGVLLLLAYLAYLLITTGLL